MKRFHFKLEKVLTLRGQEEELVKLKLGQKTRACEEIQIGLEEVARNQRESRTDVSTASFLLRQNWLHRLSKEKKRLEEGLKKAEEERLLVLDEYTIARQKAEVLRNLREKKAAEYRIDMIRQDDANLDDLVQSRGRA